MGSDMKFDVIIIGSGQAGTPLASSFANAKKKTALIESTHIAGCCVNEGCTPTKTMISSGRVAHLSRRGPTDYGVLSDIHQSSPYVDMNIVRERKRKIVSSFRGGSEKRVAAAGVEVFDGVAKFVGDKNIQVDLKNGETVTLSAQLIFINTGERPSRPTIEGLDNLDPAIVLDSTSIMELSAVPKHLLVVGGGYIALEFAQLFRRLGSEVTIIQRSPRLAPRSDPDISTSLQEILQEDGIKIHLQSSPIKVEKEEPGVKINVQGKDPNPFEIRGSHILLATGRVPNTERLNLSTIGLKTTPSGHIATNDRLETSVPGIYALGDVKGGPAFTHISYDDFRIARDTFIGTTSTSGAAKKTSYAGRDRILPYVVFTDPQLGHVGLTELEARKAFPERDIQTAKMPMAYVARALETDEARGLMKAVVDGNSGEILGFSCLGIEGGELMTVVQVAMMGGVKWWDLGEAVFAHPTLSESLNNLWGFLSKE